MGYLSRIPVVGGALQQVSDAFGFSGNKVPKQPGVVTAPGAAHANGPSWGSDGHLVGPNGNKLTLDPLTGTYYDQTTGTAYNNQGTPVTDPNLAQQAAQNFAARNAFLDKAGQQDPGLDKVEGQQQALVGSLEDTIHNPNASSVARTQLAQTMDANGRQILGTAAGVGGANAYDARRAGLNALAGANTQAVGNSALVRAQEVANAQGQEGGVLNQAAGGLQARQNTNVEAGKDFATLAAEAAAKKAQLDEDSALANQKQENSNAGARGKGLSALGDAL